MDYKFGLSAALGLDAGLPNLNIDEVRNDPSWTFTFKPSCRHWEYRGNREVIGFDPTGRMLYLGKTRTGEDLWLIVAPNECVGPEGEMQPVGKAEAPARMDRPAMNVMWAFFLHLFAQMRYSDFVNIRGAYPDIQSERTLAKSTNIL